mgnify:CR=1 FL=1
MKYDSLFSLKRKIAVVVGGAGLLGREIVQGFAELGASVMLADCNKKKGISIAEEMQGLGLDVEFELLDIASEQALIKLISDVHKKHKKIDIWVNCAYPKTKDWGAKFEKIHFSSWRKNIDMHLNGYYLCCKKIMEYMVRQRSGSIINFASIYGMLGPTFSVYQGTKMTMPAAYAAIKGGIINFTRFLAAYGGRYNIRVNSISPGGVWNNQPAQFVRRYVDKVPLDRMADKEDIAGGVIYLASDASKYVTGHNLIIDGGWSII